MGFEITDNSLKDLYDAFERIESCKVEEPSSCDKHKSDSATKSYKKTKSSSQNLTFHTFCELHSANKGHNTSNCKALLQQAWKMKESFCSNTNKRDYKRNSKSSNFPKTKAELNSYAKKYFKSKMKSIEKEHFNMDEFNHNIEDKESKASNLIMNNKDTLNEENNNF